MSSDRTAAFIADATALLKQLNCAPESKAEADRRKTLALLRDTGEPLSRCQFNPGHLTASGFVLSPDRTRILLVHHRRLNRWLQPGGHVEAVDEHPWNTAEREVTEETGVSLDNSKGTPVLRGVHVHLIPAGADEPAHLHHDLMFGFTASTLNLAPDLEVLDAKWVGYPSPFPPSRRVGA